MSEFNPNDVGIANGNFYGLPYEPRESDVVLLSVPWDVTTSYSAGTSGGPRAMIDASLQVDLFDESVPRAWEMKIGTVPEEEAISVSNRRNRQLAERVISALESGGSTEESDRWAEEVNRASEEVNEYVYRTAKMYLGQGRLVGVVGGEHSVPFGLIRALAERNEPFGILHIDAHADLRRAYEGFAYSHASIMYNVLEQLPRVEKICQVAVRDFCDDEHSIMENDVRVKSFTDREIKKVQMEGGCWKTICDRILEELPSRVYISFDIDGLSPDLCPGTGTPVPGGLSYGEACYLLERLKDSGKQIIGFDLCEVSPGENGEWDANVGARMLFKLCLCCGENFKRNTKK